MRDIVMFAVVLGALPFVLFHPWIGAVGFAWLSLMNPHRLAWGPAFNFPFAAFVAVATLTGLILTRDRRRVELNGPTLALIAMVIWMCVTSLFAIHPDHIREMFLRVMKIQLMIFVTIALLQTRRQLELFVWVIALSIGFYGIKGGIFTIATGGAYRVWGPPDSFIAGNNEVALALIMIIPIMNYLRIVQSRKAIRWLLGLAMVLCALAALGSQSRGALLAIVAMSFTLWLRSRRKLASGPLLVLVGLALVAFMPATWDQRMHTIDAYQQDSSAQGRLNAWAMAYHLAKDRPLVGGGFDVATPDLFARYAPVPRDVHAAHSIYFQMLGEHGFVGLGIFLLVWWLTWRTAARVSRDAVGDEVEWARHLVGMLQVSLVGYFVGGAFLSLAYFDLPYDILVAVLVAQRLVARRIATQVARNDAASAKSAMVVS